MTPAEILTVPLALGFAVLGFAKLAGAAGMPARAAHLGFTTDAYQRIGSLELLAALGLVAGLMVPAIGAAAAVGLAVLAVGYLVLAAGAVR